MTLTDTLNHLFERYKMERTNIAHLTPELFEQLIRIFPAILIAQADGHVDTTEIIHLNKLAHYVSSKVASIAEGDLKQEIRYLTWNAHTWRKPILSTLRLYVSEHQCEQEIIDLMVSTASSSTGSLINNILISTANPGYHADEPGLETDKAATFISEEEKNEILAICKELNLLSGAEALEKLQFILSKPVK